MKCSGCNKEIKKGEMAYKKLGWEKWHCKKCYYEKLYKGGNHVNEQER